MKLSENERNAIVEYRIDKSERALNEAIDCQKLKHYSLAADRLYFSLYHIASAMLINNDGFNPKRRAGVLSILNLKYRRHELLSSEETDIYCQMFRLHKKIDEEDFVIISKREIDFYLPQVIKLHKKLKSMIIIRLTINKNIALNN